MTFKLKTYETESTLQREKEKASGRGTSHRKGLGQKISRIFKDLVKQSRVDKRKTTFVMEAGIQYYTSPQLCL